MRFNRLLFLSISLIGIVQNKGFSQDITQNSNVNNYLSTMFEDMELNRVPTGYLLDRAFEVADLSLFNGQTLSDANLADIGIFRNSLLTINSSVVNSNGQSHNVDSLLNVMADSTAVVLGAAIFKYNYIVANALTDNLITYQNNKVHDVYSSGVWQNPYGSAYAFVFSPSVDYIEGETVRYKFSPSSIIGNSAFQSVEFDPGNGDGYSTISGNYDQTVNYSEAGTKELKMRITLNDNSVLLGHASIEVSGYQMAQYSSSTEPDRRKTYTYSVSQNNTISAIVSFKCAPGHNGKIIRPLIYVEGFDDPKLSKLLKILKIFKLQKDSSSSPSSRYSKGEFDFYWLYDEILEDAEVIKNNFDIVYVDWTSPSADIRDNAVLLKQIIIDINDEKHSCLSWENNIVVCHSMGGLIARYALRTMEISVAQHGGARHETAYYVSLDSPQRGANLPLGIQYAFRDVQWLLYGDNGNGGILSTSAMNSFINHVIEVLESPSARQMMYYYVSREQTRITSFHDSWQDTLNLKGYPEGDFLCPIENLAVSNGGSLSNVTDPLLNIHLNAGNQGYSWLTFILRLLTFFDNINATFTVNHNRGDGGLISSATATVNKKYKWLPEGVDISLFGARNTSHYSPNGAVDYDVVRSSYLSFDETTFAPNNDTLSLITTEQIAFIPEASALDVERYDRNYYLYPPKPFDETPFHAYFIRNTIKTHTDHSDIWSWLLNQTNLSFDRISGFIQTGDTLSVSDNSGYPTKTWTTSDSAIATVSSTEVGNKGIVTIHSPGPVRISYCSDNGSAFCYKHRDVFAGFPEMVLKKGYSGSGTYTITASCANLSISSSFSEYVGNGVFFYVWGRKSGTNDIVWEQPCQSSSFQCAVSPNETVSVYLKIRAENGSTGDPVFIQVQKENVEYFSHDPQAVYVYDRLIDYDLQYITGFIQDGDLHIRPWFLSLWRNPSHPNNLVPQKVKMGTTEEIGLTASYSYNLDGSTITLYRFDIMQSELVLETIDDIRSYSGSFPYYNCLLRIPVYCNNEIEQYIVLPFIKVN